jgi:hypothetical protein
MRKETNPYTVLLVVLWILLVFSVNCGTPEVVTKEPPEAKAKVDQVWREATVVYVGHHTQDPLPTFDSNTAKTLNTGDAVATNVNGQARLELSDCSESLYVFMLNSGALVRATCTESQKASGSDLCLTEGTGWFSGDCAGATTKIWTPTARIKFTGTSFSVTYLPEQRETTLVVVMEGSIVLEPVLDTATGKMGQEIQVDAGQFVYTMPDDMLTEIVPGIPPRDLRPVKDLPPLLPKLGVEEWIVQVEDFARSDGVLPPSWPEELVQSPDDRLSLGLEFVGPQLEDPEVQRGILTAVGWSDATRELFGDRDVLVATQVLGRRIDARTYRHDPAEATKLLAGVKTLQIVIPAGDDEIRALAEVMTGQLDAANVVLEWNEVPLDAMEEKVKTLQAAGMSVLWLRRD